MSFRDDREAMVAHVESLRRELAIARAERDQLAARAASLEAANAALTAEVEALRARLPRPAPPPPVTAEMPAGEILFQISERGAEYREVRLSQSIIKIGRLASSHLCLSDVEVSRMHAVIEVTDGRVDLIDLGSARGTLVNGERVNKKTLASGDLIEVGDSSIRVYFGW